MQQVKSATVKRFSVSAVIGAFVALHLAAFLNPYEQVTFDLSKSQLLIYWLTTFSILWPVMYFMYPSIAAMPHTIAKWQRSIESWENIINENLGKAGEFIKSQTFQKKLFKAFLFSLAISIPVLFSGGVYESHSPRAGVIYIVNKFTGSVMACEHSYEGVDCK